MEDGIFSDEEKAILSRFVTNIDGNVFVLRNLPEVIKGALFSRYSRSTKGLRQLLIDEFIRNPETGIKNIEEFATSRGDNELLAIQKAQDFYDRILDGFGDDSVGELGGAHVAIENISNIATKVIEDARIGGSPLEKSSRYVWFHKKINGEYQFVRDPNIMSSRHADDYVRTCNHLFKTYESLIEPVKKYFLERIPQEEGTPDQAYKFSIRAKACDSLRALLPASTKTNMGVFGNGRFFESLILRLRTHPLKEMDVISDGLQSELGKIIPSFVRRCERGNKHYEPMSRYLVTTMNNTRKAASEIMKDTQPNKVDEIELVDYDKDADDKLLSALLYQYTTHPMKQIREKIRTLDDNAKRDLFKTAINHRQNRRHKPPRAFENAYFTYDILGDFGIYRDLHRHRILTQERQDLSTRHGYDLPEDIVKAGFEGKWREAMEMAKTTYEKIYPILPRQAQYVVPFGYFIRWYITMNPRAIYWMTELRTSPQGHPNYRRIAQKMYKQTINASPLIFEYARYVDMNDYSLGRLSAETKIANKGVVKKDE